MCFLTAAIAETQIRAEDSPAVTVARCISMYRSSARICVSAMAAVRKHTALAPSSGAIPTLL